MKIFLVGGGSGGHLTPLLAVASELKKLREDAELVYIAHRGDDLHDLVKDHLTIARTHSIFAGKLRRYHRAGWKQVFDIATFLKNLCDLCYLLLGLLQSLVIIKREKPDILFIKGGFVGVPVGLAARFWRIPYITHDSDALPGLANRVLAKKAAVHAVALPKELYKYPADKTVEVGVPVSSAYVKVTESSKKAARNELGIPVFAKVLLITGGGLGAQRVNDAVLASAPSLFQGVQDLFILHQAGKKNEDSIRARYDRLPAEQSQRVRVYGFVDNLAQLSASADVIVSRAGATNMAELALQAKPVIMVPNPMLTGGHQIKNAEAYQNSQAAVVVEEKALQSIGKTIAELLNDPVQQSLLSERLGAFARPDAAKKMAELILEVAKDKKGVS